MQYYYGGDVEYIQDGAAYGAKYVNTVMFNNSFDNYYVAVQNVDLKKLAESIDYEIVKSGVRYSLIKEK